MTIPLKVDDIASYLADTGWERDPQGWRGASVWQHPGDYEVLVPARDGMGDNDRRLREILRCLCALEDRPTGDIALEIARPQLDKQSFRTFPTGHDPGYTSLLLGTQTVLGVRNVLTAAARTVVQGPHFAFAGRQPGVVGDLLRAAELGPSRPGSYVVEIRVAADATARTLSGEQVTGRAVLVQMFEAVSAAQAAVAADAPAAFDETVTAGVSADLCKALSELSGFDRREPFEIGFRWARSQPLDVPSRVVAFPETSGSLLHAASLRLRGLNATGAATVSGLVEGLHDDSSGNDRWRIKVRGELSTEHAELVGRAVWVRLPDQVSYDRAITAHRERQVITVMGELSSKTGRVELVPGRGFDV
ncbi:hypothetical protein [Streptomyces sp. DSM 40484]|uniref:hypothetical protein n=1 Tax=Streptomyces kroppenstedtii TaxID=3051181 RepID=UPI0028D7FF45|nr:hypothetical protein [Streptomyces sp. DSM 40484]